MTSYHLPHTDHYGSKLEDLMQEMVLISEISNLSKKIRSFQRAGIKRSNPNPARLQQWNMSLASASEESTVAQDFDLHATTKLQLTHMLGEWEEPDIPPSARKMILRGTMRRVL